MVGFVTMIPSVDRIKCIINYILKPSPVPGNFSFGIIMMIVISYPC